MSFSTILSAVIEGLEVAFIHVEADISNGLPVFHMVGYLSSEVKEAGERVRTAIKNSGFEYPAKRTVVNLSPATMRKHGASFDLPIAAAILTALGQIEKPEKDCLIIGELSLGGSVKKVSGVLPIVMEAKEKGVRKCIVPSENVTEASLVSEMEIVGAATLQEAVEAMQNRRKRKKIQNKEITDCGNLRKTVQKETKFPDFADMKGQEFVKRAAEIAVAGGHNLLLIGPPGSGKSMTAKCIAGILPPLDLRESLEITKIYSVLGLVDEKTPLIVDRPFREVHHTATKAALIGGGTIPHPGEISLAHKGVLFLDELPEFRRDTLEVLRQPLEERYVNLSRTYGNYTFPANFMLVAAMNPCPCGCFPNANCTCTPLQIQAYQNRISRPFLDRIDLCVEASQVKYEHLSDEQKGESSKEIRKRICRVREMQRIRYKETGNLTNAMLEGDALNKYCKLGTKEKKAMEQAFSVMNLTARGYSRILKTARTIADLEESDAIKVKHLQEALGYRMDNRKYTV